MDGMSGWKGAVGKIDLDAFFQLAEEVSPFHPLLDPAFHPGFFLGCRENLHGIPHAHASGRAKNRTPFHLAALALSPPPGFQQARGRLHQGIARHGGLAKDRAPYLVRRDEPSTGALPSNAILRFEKATHTYHDFIDQRCPVHVAWLFYRYFGQCVWLCVCRSSRPSQGLYVSFCGGAAYFDRPTYRPNSFLVEYLAVPLGLAARLGVPPV